MSTDNFGALGADFFIKTFNKGSSMSQADLDALVQYVQLTSTIMAIGDFTPNEQDSVWMILERVDVPSAPGYTVTNNTEVTMTSGGLVTIDSMPWTKITGKPSIPADVSDLTDTTSLLGSGSASWPVTNTDGASGPTLIAIGLNAGLTSQGGTTVAIGAFAGQTTQGVSAVAVGFNAGQTTQGASAVAIGMIAGYSVQGNYAVAIGDSAGYTNQGVNAVAIGKAAGSTNQANNTIIINATGNALEQTTANTFTVAPIRNASGTSGVLQYNTATKEVSYSNEITVNSNVWTFGTDGALTLPAGGDIVDSTGTTVLGGGTTLPANASGYLVNDGTGALSWAAGDGTFSGVYADLTSKPTLFDGDYNSLTNKPTYRIAVATGSGPGGNLQADSLALAGLNPVTDIPSTWGGDLILQGGVGGANGDLYGEVRIKSGQIGANYEWHFTTDKKIKLPAGGSIVDSTGATAFVSLATLKQVVADSTDFADFKSRIAGM